MASAATLAQNCFEILRDKGFAFTAGGMMVNNMGKARLAGRAKRFESWGNSLIQAGELRHNT